MSYTNKPNDNDRIGYISDRKAAEILSVSTRTFWRLVDGGYMPRGVKIGPRLVRWRLADILAAAERKPA